MNNDGNRFSDRAPGFARNVFVGPAFFSFDPRLTRNIRLRERVTLQLIGEAFNVFNHSNFTSVNTTFYTLTGSTLVKSPTFGQPTATTDPRIVQLAAKFVF